MFLSERQEKNKHGAGTGAEKNQAQAQRSTGECNKQTCSDLKSPLRLKVSGEIVKEKGRRHRPEKATRLHWIAAMVTSWVRKPKILSRCYEYSPEFSRTLNFLYSNGTLSLLI
jgi:hypothetical protein